MQQTKNIKQIEADELAKCFTQIANSMAIIYEANGNVTPLTRMLDEMNGRINQMRVLRTRSNDNNETGFITK